MFYENDPDSSEYKTRAHLVEVIGMLGPPPLDLLQRGKRRNEFFTPDGEFIQSSYPQFQPTLTEAIGQWRADIPIPEGMSLEASEENLEGDEKAEFIRFMRSMLQC